MAILTDYLTNIANAIRNKKGTTDPINAQNFASEIESIEGGGGGATLNRGWVGTAVPYDSTTLIENIYLNTYLPKEEVATLLQNNFNLYPSVKVTDYAIIAYSENVGLVFLFLDSISLIFDLINEIYYFVYDGTGQGRDIADIGFSGWNPELNGVIAYNSTNALLFGENLGSQQGNDELKTLFSITPLEKEEPIQLSGEYTSKTINETINVVENGTTTLSYASDFDTNKEILNKVDIVFNVSTPNIAQMLIGKRGGAYLFYGAQYLTNNDLEAFFNGVGTSSVTNTEHMFDGCKYLTTIPLLDTSSVTNMSYMFRVCQKITTIPLLDTSSVTNMSGMFENCSVLTSIPQLVTSEVTNMSEMFKSCSSLKATDIPLFDTSNVIYMGGMFQNCTQITTIPLFDTSKVTIMSDMFRSCYNLTTLPQLDTSRVIDMSYMFTWCTRLTTIPLLDTSNVTDMVGMFSSCSQLTTIPQLNTSKVTIISNMFENCTNLTTLPQLDTSNVYNIKNMFSGCSSLTTIDITRFNPSSPYNSANFAYNCCSLTKLIIRTMSTIPVFGTSMFDGCFHFLGTQNDTYNPDGLKDGRIYVPDDKVASLKAATGWSNYADIIVPLSTLVE